MRNHRRHGTEPTMAATGSDGILAYNLTSNLCGVQTDQFIATTRTYDLIATSQNQPHYAMGSPERFCRSCVVRPLGEPPLVGATAA